MKIVGLITEYNPFHNGHLYHLEQSLKRTNADAAVVVMSGNFVQRGTPAMMPKHLRTEMALKSGVAAVFELPVCYANGSAEYFALGAISFFHQLGCIDSICFGTESGDLSALDEIAQILVEEPPEYKTYLQMYLKEGNSFPAAREKALSAYTGDNLLSYYLAQPNNILGIEYLKALYTLKSPIRPYCIKRKESDYHDTELKSQFSSASAIRKLLAYSGNALHREEDSPYDSVSFSYLWNRLEDQVPSPCIRLLEETHQIRYPVYANDFSLILQDRLLHETSQSLVEILDVSEDLANRILKQRNNFLQIDQFCEHLKTKQYTYARICRALFHIILQLRENDVEQFRANQYHGYARLLGFRKDSTEVLTKIKETSSIPILSKPSASQNLSPLFQKMLAQDIFASDLYESVITNKFQTPFQNEHKHSIVRI